MKKQSTLIIACLAAATAGVVIGMLIAPEDKKNFKNNLKSIADGLLSKFGKSAGAEDDEDHFPESKEIISSN